MRGQLRIGAVDLRVIQVWPVHAGLEVAGDQPRGDPAEELERGHMAFGPGVLVQPDHRAHEHVPRAAQHHHERPDHMPGPGHRIGPPAQLPVIDLGFLTRLARRQPQHPHLLPAHLLRHVRRHIPAQARIRRRQPVLIGEPLVDRLDRHPSLQLPGDEAVMFLDLRPGHLPQPGIGQLREPPRGPVPPLRRADRRPARNQALRLRRGQVLTDRLAIQPQAFCDLVLAPARIPVRQDLRHIHHVERSPCHRPPAPSRRREASCLPDDQARTDTHAIPMRNYVTPAVGNYVLTSALQLGNYVIADTRSARPGHDLAAQACRRHVFVVGRGIPANRAGMKQAPLDLLDYRDLNRSTRRHGLAGDV
jgi:hypothetical protein